MAALLFIATPNALAAAVSGNVTDGTNGIWDVCVQLQDSSTPGMVLYQTTSPTDVFGHYQIDGVTAGNYKAYFAHCPTSGLPIWVAQYWYNKSSWQSADTLTVPAGGLSNLNAVMQPGHTISGRVTSNGSTGLENICVTPFPVDGSPPVYGAATDVNGFYTMSPVPYASYKVRFAQCGGGTKTLVPQWYDGVTDQQDATILNLATGNQSGIDAVMSQTGYTISGHVQNAGGTGIPGICVQLAVPVSGGGWKNVGWGGNTNQNGDYTSDPTPAGTYRVQFNDCNPSRTYLSEWWNDKDSFQNADAISLTSSQTGINAVLASGYTISGQVSAGGTGVSGICVNAMRSDQMMQLATTQTVSGGTYTLGPVAGGTQYKVQFSDCRTTPQYIEQWYNGAANWNNATPVPVSNSNVTGINASLTLGRTVSGRVTSDGTTGIQGVCVSLMSPDGQGMWYGARQTQADGSYTSMPVAPGTYVVQFRDCRPSPQYVTEFWDNQPSMQTATPIDLTSGNVSGKNAGLAPGYTISGQVSDGSAGVQGVCVGVWNTAWQYPGWQAAGGQTQTGGNYTTDPLPPGTYKIYFNDCRPTPTLIAEWYDNATSYETATPVPILSSNVTGRNAVVAPGHTISGTVTGSGDGALSNIAIGAYPASGPGPVEGQNPPYFTFTDNNGHYRLGPLPSDNYRITFVDWNGPVNWFSEWYNDQPDFAHADSVNSVSDPTNINAVLTAGRTISGTVTRADGGTGIENVCVGVFDASDPYGQGVAGSMTDSNGAYTVGPLHDGHSYLVQFNDCNAVMHYIGEFWDNQPDSASATPIAINGSDVTGKDAVLARGYTISGRVTNNSGSGIENVCVQVLPANDPDPWSHQAAWAQTGSGGYYTTGPLRAGEYKLGFNDCNQPQHYIEEWWNNQPSYDAGNAITVSTADLTGYNAVLTYGHTISGTVTGAGGAGPLENICVSVVSSTNDGNEVGWAGTGGDGSYTTSPLAAGTYKLRFDDCNNPSHWISEWWNDKSEFDQATLITVSGTDLVSHDAILAYGYTISGHVVDDMTGDPVTGICTDVFRVSDGSYMGGGGTDGNGDYRTQPIAPGIYRVGFGPCEEVGEYIYEFYDDVQSMEQATPVDISAGDVSGIDAAVMPGHRISGHVTVPGGAPNTVCVGAYTLTDSQNQVWGTQVGDDGRYLIGPLPFGSYKLQFFDCRQDGSEWASEWYDNQPDFATADPVDITSQHVDGIDATLARVPVKPTIADAAQVEDVTTTSAEIGGTVNPNGFATTYHFDYGLTSAYGSRAPATDATLVADASDHYVGQPVSGLLPDTTYHFRLVATNVAGTTYGGDHTFTTAKQAPPAGDTDPPVVAITCPAGTVTGSSAFAHWTASDALSGLATPTSGDVALDTATAGTKVAVAPDARDQAGNVRSGVSCQYTVTSAAPAQVPVVKTLTKKVTATTKGYVVLKLRCTGAPCTGKLSLTATVKVNAKKKLLKLGTKSYTIRTSGGSVKIRLSKANLATLKRLKRITATAKVTVTGGKTVTAKVVISAPKRAASRVAQVQSL